MSKKDKEPSSVMELLHQLQEEGVPEKEYKSRVDWFLETRARENGIPLRGHFELTPLCNLDCRMCYVHLEESQFSVEELIPVEDWKKVMLQAHEMGMMRASLTGGECLTYPGFDDVFLFLEQLGVRIHVLTNGLLMNEDRIAFFKEHVPELIQVSVYGSCEEAYEKVTGKRAFRTVKNNIFRMKEAGLPVSLAITPNRFMKGDIDSIIDFAESTGVPYDINPALSESRNNAGRKIEDFTTDEYIKIYSRRKMLRGEEINPVAIVDLPDEKRDGEKINGLDCGGGRSGFAMKYDGTISPCLDLYEISADPFKMGFRKAWEIINDAANAYPLPSECKDCAYEDVCETCAAVHKEFGNPGHCDPLVCEKTKALVAAGIYKIDEDKN